MQRLLIALQGTGNSGKTTVLSMLYTLLINDNKSIRHLNKIAEDWQPIKNTVQTPVNTDFTEIIELENNNKSTIKIGIATGGDTIKIVENNLKFFDNHECNVMFCATKASGQTVESLHSYIDKNKNIRFLPFFKAKEKKQHDSVLANELFTTAKYWWNAIC